MRIARAYGHKVKVILKDNNIIIGNVINFENQSKVILEIS